MKYFVLIGLAILLAGCCTVEEMASVLQDSVSGDEEIRCAPDLEEHGGFYTCRVIKAEGKNIYLKLHASYLDKATGILLNESKIETARYVDKPFSQVQLEGGFALAGALLSNSSIKNISIGQEEMNCTFADYVFNGEELNLTISCDKEIPAESATYVISGVLPVVFNTKDKPPIFVETDSKYCKLRDGYDVCYLDISFMAERRA